MSILTPHLKHGSIVDVIAPASACSKNELQGGLRFLKQLGLRPRVSPKIFDGHKIFASSDRERFAQLKKALLSSDSDAIWCIRGGYGSLRLLPHLARLRRPKRAKLFLGFSDVTSLHLFLNQEWKWPTIHSPVLARFGRGPFDMREIRDLVALLFGAKPSLIHSLKPLNSAARKARIIRSSLVGGNLATLQSSLGTPWAFAPGNRIIAFEDRFERPHRVDRMLTQMEQAGIFRKTPAVIFGDLSELKLSETRLLWSDVIDRFAKAQTFPVFKGLQMGHGKLQRPIPFLTQTILFSGRLPRVEISDDPVHA